MPGSKATQILSSSAIRWHQVTKPLHVALCSRAQIFLVHASRLDPDFPYPSTPPFSEDLVCGDVSFAATRERTAYRTSQMVFPLQSMQNTNAIKAFPHLPHNIFLFHCLSPSLPLLFFHDSFTLHLIIFYEILFSQGKAYFPLIKRNHHILVDYSPWKVHLLIQSTKPMACDYTQETSTELKDPSGKALSIVDGNLKVST